MSAEDRGSGFKNAITLRNTITSCNGERELWRNEIGRMLAEADEYWAEDEAVKTKVEAKEALENYVYEMRDDIREMELGDHQLDWFEDGLKKLEDLWSTTVLHEVGGDAAVLGGADHMAGEGGGGADTAGEGGSGSGACSTRIEKRS